MGNMARDALINWTGFSVIQLFQVTRAASNSD
jgi:hypothetical protein